VPQADSYKFTGLGPLGYPSYIDVVTEQMLIAETGGTYGMRSNEEGFPIPPGDGRWTAVRSAPPSPVPAAKPAASVPAASEGAAA
jgi:hypothetical protein